MTERDELVERVRTMILNLVFPSKNSHISYDDAGDIARAAIMECEKDRYALGRKP